MEVAAPVTLQSAEYSGGSSGGARQLTVLRLQSTPEAESFVLHVFPPLFGYINWPERGGGDGLDSLVDSERHSIGVRSTDFEGER